ncbi:CDP-diacylglycerol--glycerol-3-phosphate 3-phosphatidyltransferase [soil metagenome]
MKKQIPNLLTGARLVLCLVNFAALAILAGMMRGGTAPVTAQVLAYVAVISFVVAAVTDFFDGYLARRWKVVSMLGAILDPIADKILVCGCVLGLIAVNAPGVLIPGAAILFREFSISALREVLAPRGIKLPVTFLAKTKTTLQLVALTVLMIVGFWGAWGIPASQAVLEKALIGAEVLWGFAAAVTLWTGIEYALAARKALKSA